MVLTVRLNGGLKKVMKLFFQWVFPEKQQLQLQLQRLPLQVRLCHNGHHRVQEDKQYTSIMKKLIEIKKLKKAYYVGEVTVHAIRGIDMEINEGEFVAIMGASGSGKSTMLNIIGCLDKPTEGEYILDGTAISKLSKNE